MSPPAEKGKGKEAEPDPLVFRPCSRRRVNPRAASDGGAWRGRAATVPGVHGFTETFPANSRIF